jgi:hypothetical protein
MLSQSWLLTGLGIVLLLVAIPLSICALSKRHKHPNIFLVILSCVGGGALMRAGFITAAALNGESMFLEPPEQLRFWLGFAGISVVLIGLSLVMRLFGRRVLRSLFQRHRIVAPLQVSNLCPECNPISSAKRQKDVRRWMAVAAPTLLAATLYVGEHFAVVRDLRNDALSTGIGRTEMMILAELEKLTEPLVGRARAQIMETVSSSFRGGINARYQRAILVNGEDLCYASFEKNLLIPWVQVEVFRMGTVADIQQRAIRGKKVLSKERPSGPPPAAMKDPPATARKE